jgi:rod shape-determining protein MreC
MHDFFRSWQFKLIAALAAVLLGVMLYSASCGGEGNIFQNAISFITVPFQKGATYVSDSVTGFFDRYLQSAENYEENQELKETVRELREQLTEYENIKNENEQLRQIVGMTESDNEMTFCPATVISRDTNDAYGSFVIDKGTLDGVSINDPVVSSEGLVGIITAVSPINARVKTILSPDVSVGAYEIQSKELGVCSGDAELAIDGYCKLSILSNETTITKGDLIVTSGSSGIYPRGLTIGTAQDIYQEEHGVTLYAIILPVSEIDDLKNVYVITDFKGKGSVLDGYSEQVESGE